MPQKNPDYQVNVPAPADAVALLGVLLVLVGALMVGLRLAWLAWDTWAWWSGLVFAAAGVTLFLLATAGAWLYTRGIPVARARYHRWRLKRERQARERQQEREQHEVE